MGEGEREREENEDLFQESANYGLWTKTSPLLVFAPKPLLEHRPTHSFTIRHYESSVAAFMLHWKN